jgi:uncharacterized paraquat-inducible protein A
MAEDDPAPGQYEGSWSRIWCPHCEAPFYVEEDLQDGNEAECEFCDATLRVERGT